MKHRSSKGAKTGKPVGAETRDKSVFVPQDGKIAFDLHIRERDDVTPKQRELIDLILDKKTNVVFINGPAGTSKAQPLDAKILTPNGWTTMGSIKPGDIVLSSDGQATKVISVHPQGKKPIYSVSFSDGSSTECCLDHLWLTQTVQDRNARIRVGPRKDGKRVTSSKVGTVKTLQEIVDTLYVRHGKRPNHYIPITAPVNMPERRHVISPYVMGVLLGDGCFRGDDVTFTNVDIDLIDAVKKQLPDGLELANANDITYRIRRTKGNKSRRNPFYQEIERLGLKDLKSCSKFIPDEYLFDSIEHRLDLLRGLMDTDGWVAKGWLYLALHLRGS